MSAPSRTRPFSATVGHPKQWLRKEWPLASLLSVVIFLTLLPVVVFGYQLIARSIDTRRVDEVEKVAAIARTLADAVDRELIDYSRTAQLLASSRLLQQGDIEAFDRAAREAVPSVRGHFVLFDRTFQILADTRREPGDALPRITGRDADRHVFEGVVSNVTDLVIEPITKTPGFSVQVPVVIDGEARYGLAFVPQARSIYQIIRQQYRPEGWFASVLDSDGRIIARSYRHDEFFGKYGDRDFLLRLIGRRGTIETVDLEGRSSITAFHTSVLSGWRAVVWAPTELIEAPARAAMSWTLVAISLAVGLSAISAAFAARLIKGPIGDMVAAARMLGEGGQPEVRASIMQESNAVVSAMARAAQEIRARQEALKSTEASLRLALDSANATAFSWDIKTNVIRRPHSSIVGLDTTTETNPDSVGRFLDQVHPDDRQAFDAAIETALHKMDGSYRNVFRIIADEGSVRWLEDCGRVELDETGKPQRLVGIAMDVTDRMNAEQKVALLAAVANAAHDAIIGVALDGTIQAWNGAAERLFGYSNAEAIGMPVAVIAPPELVKEQDEMRRLVSQGQAIGPFDTTRVRKEGTTVDVSVSVAPILGREDNVVGMSAAMHEITERKRAEQHTRFMMRELSHRSKNLLAIVQAIASQTARSCDTIEEFRHRYGERIASLARSHDLLVERNWTGISIAELVQTQLAPFVDSMERRVTAAGPPLLLNPEGGQNIGMALHELATNASKYGALSSPTGTITVTWAIGPGDRGPQLTIRWQEMGGPPVAQPARTGFGHVVVEQIVATALDGKARLSWEATGVVWELRIPARWAFELPADAGAASPSDAKVGGLRRLRS